MRLSLTNASLLQITSRPLVSKRGPPVNGTLRADEIGAQSPSTPPFLAHILPLLRRPPSTPAWGPSVLPGSENGVPLQQANNDKEQENIASITEIVSGTTTEPLLHSDLPIFFCH